jgi:hypothetical protein
MRKRLFFLVSEDSDVSRRNKLRIGSALLPLRPWAQHLAPKLNNNG